MANTNTVTHGCGGTAAWFFFQAEDGIRDYKVTGVQTCALPIFLSRHPHVSVDLEERLSDEIVGLIAEGVGDVGIVAGTVDMGALETFPFRSDRFRSEERRVGKECRSRWSPDH